MDLPTIALFKDINEYDLTQLLQCCDAKTRTYQKDDFIWLAGDAAKHIGVVLSGSVNIVKEDVLGYRHIIGKVAKGHIFGETFACAALDHYPVTVEVAEQSEIMLLSLGAVLAQCPKSCTYHNQLIHNLISIIAEKNLLLNQKISFLSQKTTRQKIANLLLSHMHSAQDTTVTLPYNREEMADYLGLNRSALSRELGWLKEKGLIDYKKSEFNIVSLDGLGELLVN